MLGLREYYLDQTNYHGRFLVPMFFVCAHMCVNFEESEYVKGGLDYSEMNKAKTINIHRSTKTVVPAAVLEKDRMYE